MIRTFSMLIVIALAGCLMPQPTTVEEDPGPHAKGEEPMPGFSAGDCSIYDVVYPLPYEQVRAYEYPDAPFMRTPPLDEVRVFLKSFQCELSGYLGMEGGLTAFAVVGIRVDPSVGSAGEVDLELVEAISDSHWFRWWLECARMTTVQESVTHIDKIGHHDLRVGWDGDVLRYRALFPDSVPLGPADYVTWNYHVGDETRHQFSASFLVQGRASDAVLETERTPFAPSQPLVATALALDDQDIEFQQSWGACEAPE